MRAPVSVTNVTVTTVTPLEKTDHVKSIHPMFIDLVASDCYFPTLNLYRLPNNSEAEYQKFASLLKCSLRKVLVPFFPYAGRWMFDGGIWTLEGRRGYLLDCNDKGVPFIEAYVDRDIDSVVRAGGGFEAVPELSGHEVLGMNSLPVKQKMQPDGMPPIFVQLTRFRCGGVALAVAFFHVTCDAEAFYEFMNSWAEVARTGSTSVVPRMDREMAVTLEKYVWQLDQDKLPVLRDMLSMHSPCGRTPNPKGCIMRLYEVSAATINILKEKALESSGGQFVSTNDCIVAQLWKLAASLPASMTDGKPSTVMHIAEGRHRFFDSPLPHLLGNVYFPTVCPMPPTSELLKEPLHSIALRVRENLLQTDWKSLFNMDSALGTVHAFSMEFMKTWLHTSWYKFRIYDVDFGVGCAPYFSPGVNSSFDHGFNVSIVVPSAPANASSAASVLLFLTQEALDFLEALPNFWNFFLPWEKQHHDYPSPEENPRKMDLPPLEKETVVLG